jgi:hypothetical protein
MDGRIYQGVGRKMIKVETKDGLSEIEMQGTVSDIVSDLCIVIASVYNGLVERMPHKKETIEDFIKKNVADGSLFNMKEDGEADD